MIEINEKRGQTLDLKITGENFHSDVKFIKKEMLGREYNAETKMWQIPILKTNFKRLKEGAKKTFLDHDALWAFEAEDYAPFMTVDKKGDDIQLKS